MERIITELTSSTFASSPPITLGRCRTTARPQIMTMAEVDGEVRRLLGGNGHITPDEARAAASDALAVLFAHVDPNLWEPMLERLTAGILGAVNGTPPAR